MAMGRERRDLGRRLGPGGGDRHGVRHFLERYALLRGGNCRVRLRDAAHSMTKSSWTLLDAKGRPYQSAVPGSLGGHRRHRIYGRLDCRAAKQAIARSGYVKDRVFFIDERTAKAAGKFGRPAIDRRPCKRATSAPSLP